VKLLPIFPKLEEPAPRKGFFEHDEFPALREELPEHLRPPLTFAYFTGCRRGEILGLQWSQVDLDRHIVRLNAGETKSGDGRLLPLGSELFNVVMERRLRISGAHGRKHRSGLQLGNSARLLRFGRRIGRRSCFTICAVWAPEIWSGPVSRSVPSCR
jgi:integrase